MTDEVKLANGAEPCRLCGWRKPLMGDGYVECPDCFARGPVEESPAEAIAAWNTRPSTRPPADVGERVRRVHDLLNEDARSRGFIREVQRDLREIIAALEASSLPQPPEGQS